MIPFRIEIEAEDADRQVTVAKMTGRLNAASSPEAKDRLKGLAGEGSSNLLLDLSELSFIDSSGLSALVSGYKAAVEAGGSLKLAGLVPQVREVFALTHLDRVFETFPDVATALASFPSGN